MLPDSDFSDRYFDPTMDNDPGPDAMDRFCDRNSSETVTEVLEDFDREFGYDEMTAPDADVYYTARVAYFAKLED